MKFQYPSGSRPLEGYTIKRGIGRGGFGEVYFATSDAGKEVALKHIERNLEVELRGVSQCLNLKHANLIDLYDIRYDEQGDAWVVMEYVAGPSLKDAIDRHSSGLPRAQVEFWLRGIAAGVGYLHEHGIVHRDLKPGNIFEDAGYVKIGDYGLSKFISCSRRSGQTESVGTCHYMAPEIGKGCYGKEIDIYALGIVLYEMLTGRVPFDGESSQEIIMKHLTAEPDLTGLAEPYRGIIARALQKDPARRYHDVSELIAALGPPLRAGPRGASAAALAEQGSPGSAAAAVSQPIAGQPVAGQPLVAVGGAAPVAVNEAGSSGQPAPTLLPRSQRPEQLRHYETVGTSTTVTVLLVGALVAGLSGFLSGAFFLALAGVFVAAYEGRRFASGEVRAPLPTASAPVPRASAPLPRDIAPLAPLAHVPRSPGWHPLSWEQVGRQLLRQKTVADCTAELTSSMVAAAFWSVVLTVPMTMIGGSALTQSPHWLAGPAWLALLVTLGAWLVLAAGKSWERSQGEALKRRLATLVLGLIVGAVGYGAQDYLLVALEPGRELASRGGQAVFTGGPALAGYLAYFAAAFATVGWWKQVDPLRSSRLRIGSVLVALFAAWLWQLVWDFPQPWGFFVIAGTSIAAQLSAPWISHAERSAALARCRCV